MMSASHVQVLPSPVSVNGRWLRSTEWMAVKHHRSIEPLGMPQEALHQFRALHALRVSGPVIHFSGGHELAGPEPYR